MPSSSSELALAAMRAHDWRAAAEHWQTLLDSGDPLNEGDYAAAARVHERLGNWLLHDQVVVLGSSIWPDSTVLRVRKIHAQAMHRIAVQDWDAAEQLFDSISQDPETVTWPCAVNYHRWQLRFHRELSCIALPAKRLEVIERLALFKATDLVPQRFAGIDLAADCLAWPAPFRDAFNHAITPLLQVCMSYDEPLWLVDDPALDTSVSSLAVLWEKEGSRLEELPVGYLEVFARLFISRGFLGLYQRLRAIFVRNLSLRWQRGPANGVAELLYGVALANEAGCIDDFDEISRNPIWEDLDRKAGPGFLSLSSVYHHKFVECDLGADSEQSEFQAFVKGKSIAIVGPVNVGLPSGEEIDNFDVVVRFNYRAGTCYQQEFFGSKVDISYYVRLLLSGAPLPRLISGMSELKYAVINPYSMAECDWLDQVTCSLRVPMGNWEYLKNPLLIGYANAIQRAIFDLLRFSPSRIKVFCADLYTSMGYQPEYIQDIPFSQEVANIFPPLSLHDPISNFVLMQRFRNGGWIETDAVLNDVLELSSDDYISRLKSRHGQWVRHAKLS